VPAAGLRDSVRREDWLKRLALATGGHSSPYRRFGSGDRPGNVRESRFGVVHARRGERNSMRNWELAFRPSLRAPLAEIAKPPG
jgi:hypothetical protein